MKHIVEYSLPYQHRVQVGIQADTSNQAIERAEALFDNAEIWDDTAECPLLFDDYEEDVDAGTALVFEVKQSLEDDDEYPAADESVVRLRRDNAARAAAHALIAAYRRGEANGGHIEWSDLDAAYELALGAL